MVEPMHESSFSFERRRENARDFGNTEAEAIFMDFAQNELGAVITRVEHASRYDDEIEGKFDFILTLPNDAKLAIQFTMTESADRQKKKIQEVADQPLVEIHDEKGNVVSKEKIPKAVVYFKKESFVNAYDAARSRGGKPSEHLMNKAALKIKTLGDMIATLQLQKYYYPRLSEQFDARLQSLEQALRDAKKERAS